MEIKREPISEERLSGGAPLPFGANPGPMDFRSRQLLARDMLRGTLDDEDLERFVEDAVMTTTVDQAPSPGRAATRSSR